MHLVSIQSLARREWAARNRVGGIICASLLGTWVIFVIAWMVVSRYVRARERRRCMRRICQKMKKRSELQPAGKENSHTGLKGSEEGVWGSEYETDISLARIEMNLDHGSTNSLAATLC